jgi:hypothetical protein
MMRKSLIVYVLISALIVLGSPVLNSAQSPQVQTLSSPFTSEQTAVYHAFFTDYYRGSTHRPEAVDVSEFTEILQPDEGDYSGCMEGFPQAPSPEVIHHLTEDFARQNHLHVVDPKLHKVQDPEDGMRDGLSVESAVESGFRSGLLTISEVIFDANRNRAAFHYSFYCGRLCGHSETVVYEKRHGVWKPSKRSCGYGIS